MSHSFCVITNHHRSFFPVFLCLFFRTIFFGISKTRARFRRKQRSIFGRCGVVASIPTSSRYETTTATCTNDSKTLLSIASSVNVVHVSKRLIGTESSSSSSSFERFSRVPIESNATKMEFAPSVFGTVLACLTKRGHVELFVAKERATRPDVLFEEEEDEDDGT